MDSGFWLDGLMAACAALAGLVVAYGGWLCLADLVGTLLDLRERRSHTDRPKAPRER